MNTYFLLRVGIFLCIFTIYSFTLHPFFPLGDSGEFVVAAQTFGVSHPPGAPLYSILSSFFAAVQLGELPSRLNLLSALFGALTTIIVLLIIYRLTKHLWASVISAFFLAISYIFWCFSTIAELYTVLLFLLTTVFYFYLLFRKTEKRMFLYLFALFSGLSFTVHYISLIPFLLMAFFLLVYHKGVKTKNWSKAGGFFLLGLAPILILPLAAANNAFINWGDIHDTHSFFRFLLRQDYQIIGSGEINQFDIAGFLTIDFPYYLSTIFGSFSLAIFFAAFAFFDKAHKQYVLLTLSILLLLGPAFIAYANFPLSSPYPDVVTNHKRLMQQVYILSYPWLAILIGIGTAYIINKLPTASIKTIGYMIVVIVLGVNFATSYEKIASGNNQITKYYGESVLKTIEKPTILITGTEESNIFNYFTAIQSEGNENIRLITFSLMQHEWYIKQLKERYPDVVFPFDKVTVGQKLDMFYNANAPRFSIVFAPLDDQAIQSVPDNFTFIPYGLTVLLVPKETELNKKEYVARNKELYENLLQKDVLSKQYTDLPTNELLMSYARAYTNIGMKTSQLGDNVNALFFLDKATEMQPAYYTAYIQKAKIYAKQNEYNNVAEQYLNLIKYNDNPIYYRDLVIIYNSLGDVRNVRKYAELYSQKAQTLEQKAEAENIKRNINSMNFLPSR